jgi:hypothetical protein
MGIGLPAAEVREDLANDLRIVDQRNARNSLTGSVTESGSGACAFFARSPDAGFEYHPVGREPVRSASIRASLVIC